MRWLAAGLACTVSVFAQGQLSSSINRMVANDAIIRLNSPDAETRGEAAIIVAAAGQQIHEPRLLKLAIDPDPAARHRGILALGLLATPQAITFLEQQLMSIEGRTTKESVFAAYALGLVPSQRIETSVARLLPQFEQGSWKRQHDCMIALLLGMTSQLDRQELRPLQQLLEDAGKHADDARALLFELLLPMQSKVDAKDLRRSLRRGGDLTKLTIIKWLATRAAADNKLWLTDLTTYAKRGTTPEIRAAALLALTRSRHLPALEIAAHTLKTATGAECRQALASMLAIGGAKSRGALEQYLLQEQNPARTQALMSGYQAPPSKALMNHAFRVAMDQRQPVATRSAAAILVAKSDAKRAAPLLRDLFRIASNPATLISLARALARTKEPQTTLDRLLSDSDSTVQYGNQWQALLASGHTEAKRQVLAVLQNTKSSDEEVRTALKAWRRATVDIPVSSLAPELLRNCLN